MIRLQSHDFLPDILRFSQPDVKHSKHSDLCTTEKRHEFPAADLIGQDGSFDPALPPWPCRFLPALVYTGRRVTWMADRDRMQQSGLPGRKSDSGARADPAMSADGASRTLSVGMSRSAL